MRLLDSRTKQSHRAARGTLVARLFRSTAPSALAILVLTLFATTPPAWAQHPGNEAPHVVEQFLNMQTWGDPLAARIVSASGYSVDTLTD